MVAKRRYRSSSQIERVQRSSLCCMDVLKVDDRVLFIIGMNAYEAPFSDRWVRTSMDIEQENLEVIPDFRMPWLATENNILTKLRTDPIVEEFWVDDGNVPCLPLLIREDTDDDTFVDVSLDIQTVYMQALRRPFHMYCIPQFVHERAPLLPEDYKFFRFEDWYKSTPYGEHHVESANTIKQRVLFDPKSTLARRQLERDIKGLGSLINHMRPA